MTPSKLQSVMVQDLKAFANELAAGLKDGDEEKAIRAEFAHASALEVSRLNRRSAVQLHARTA